MFLLSSLSQLILSIPFFSLSLFLFHFCLFTISSLVRYIHLYNTYSSYYTMHRLANSLSLFLSLELSLPLPFRQHQTCPTIDSNYHLHMFSSSSTSPQPHSLSLLHTLSFQTHCFDIDLLVSISSRLS
jgi:hypothetical protein